MARYRPPPPPPGPFHEGGFAQHRQMPPPGLRRALWKLVVLIDAHFAIVMFEWWEVLIVALFVVPITILFWYSAFAYFPSHARYIVRRFTYYVFGDEKVDTLAYGRAYVAEWLNIAWLWLRGLQGHTASRVEL